MIHTRNVAILLFNEVEVLDFSGPFEVFSVTGRNQGTIPFYVFTVSEKPGPVFARNGLSINPAYTISDCPPVQILVVPGGHGTRKEMENATILEWIKARSAKSELTLSVCTGSLLLAKAGLLDGLSATTHQTSLDLLRETAPNTKILPGERFVDNGNIIVSAGISAGIDMSLHVVSRLLGQETALATARHMEYDWPRS
ncbi:MAG TPA: DJ-1/PfpI family protein [Acidobacteriota bacterium]|nr:DJ-1/PfpI family protein [Acidobacteriota bacterium]